MKPNCRKIFLVIWACIFSFSVSAQTEKTGNKNRWFSFYLGAGPNFYFNNLVLAKDYVNEYNYSVVGRIMWEPEHNLSLGIESGYYKLYSMDVNVGNSESVRIVNVAIPIQIVVSMKFFEYYYASFNVGQSILKNLVTHSSQGDFNASTISLGDFSAAIGYKRPIHERFYIGTEIRGFYSAKLQDKNIALVFLGGFRF